MANAVGPNGYDGGGGGGGSGRPPRLPRWTRQEILVLIQGKKVVEGRGRGGGRAGAEVGAEGGGGGRQQLEPKWAAVAGYCRRHGVDRGPVQCRKRWSNLAGDYKKIKEWERARGGDKGESFWAMRNDLRREHRLPGFFDREVYDILDGVAAAAGEEKDEEIEEEVAAAAAAEKKRRRRKKKEEEEVVVEEDEAEVEEAVFDSGRTAAEDGLFSDSEEEEAVAVAATAAMARVREQEEEAERSPLPPPTTAITASAAAAAAAAPVVVMPISEKKYEATRQESNEPGTSKDKQPAHDTDSEGNKRKRASDEGETNIESQLIDVLERNSRMLSAQLEAQNLNSQLDRDQRKDQTNSLLVILNKLADALGKIADKL